MKTRYSMDRWEVWSGQRCLIRSYPDERTRFHFRGDELLGEEHSGGAWNRRYKTKLVKDYYLYTCAYSTGRVYTGLMNRSGEEEAWMEESAYGTTYRIYNLTPSPLTYDEWIRTIKERIEKYGRAD